MARVGLAEFLQRARARSDQVFRAREPGAKKLASARKAESQQGRIDKVVAPQRVRQLSAITRSLGLGQPPQQEGLASCHAHVDAYAAHGEAERRCDLTPCGRAATRSAPEGGKGCNGSSFGIGAEASGPLVSLVDGHFEVQLFIGDKQGTASEPLEEFCPAALIRQMDFASLLC